MVSFDGVHRCDKSMSSSVNIDISSNEKTSKEGGTLVNPPDKMVPKLCKRLKDKFSNNHNTNLRNYIYSCELEGPRIKFLTIRPHDEFMYGRYSITDRNKCMRVFVNVINENIPYPFVGSIESNNSIFVHMHLMVLCTNSQLELIHKSLKDLFTIQHKLNQKQYAIMKSRPKSANDRLFMIRYYLGLKYNSESKQFLTKPSYLKNIVKDFPLREYDESINHELREMFDIFLSKK